VSSVLQMPCLYTCQVRWVFCAIQSVVKGLRRLCHYALELRSEATSTQGRQQLTLAVCCNIGILNFTLDKSGPWQTFAVLSALLDQRMQRPTHDSPRTLSTARVSACTPALPGHKPGQVQEPRGPIQVRKRRPHGVPGALAGGHTVQQRVRVRQRALPLVPRAANARRQAALHIVLSVEAERKMAGK